MDDPKSGIRFFVTDTPASVRSVYRALRKAGLQRHDVNMLCVGAMVAAGVGTIDVQRWPLR